MSKLVVPEEVLNGAVAIIGKTGAGKSYVARGFVEHLLRLGRRVCIIDPTGIWWGLRSSADGKRDGFPVVVFGGEKADVPITEHSGDALAELIATQNLPAIIDVSEMTMGGRTRFMTAFLDKLYAKNRLPLNFVVDEADMFAPQQPMPEQTVMLSRMEQIARRGRVRGFRLWPITQRPASLHKSVLSQADTLIAMKLVSPQDRNALGEWIKGQADVQEGKDVLADLPKLQRGTGWVWAPEFGVLARTEFPKITTFDSSRTPEHGDAAIAPPSRLADVDVSKLVAHLSDAQEEAKANDPKLLRKRIAELEDQLGDQARSPEVQVQRVEVPMLSGEQIARLEAAATSMSETGLALTAAACEISQALLKANDTAAPDCKTPPIYSKDYSKPVVMLERAVPAPRRDAPMRAGGATLSKAERLVLTALAQYPAGRSKSQVAILTGYAINGGGFNNAIGACRSKGFLEGSGDQMLITETGLDGLGSFTPLPHGRALRDYWMGQLSKAERGVLEALTTAYPKVQTKEEVAARAGYEANGGGFNNAIGRLRTLELIHGPGSALLASADLFEGGRG